MCGFSLEGASRAFGRWLSERRFRDIKPPCRHALFRIIENEAAILSWRDSLPEAQRTRLNNPDVVISAWRLAMRVKRPAVRKSSAASTLRRFLLAAQSIAPGEAEIEISDVLCAVAWLADYLRIREAAPCPTP